MISIKRTRESLARTAHTVERIAKSCLFENPHCIYAAFEQIVGQTPRKSFNARAATRLEIRVHRLASAVPLRLLAVGRDPSGSSSP